MKEDFVSSPRHFFCLDKGVHYIIYINLVSGQERPLGYYNRDFQPVSTLDAAEIIIVQGALDRQSPNFFQAAFTTFLTDLKKALKLVEENDLT